MSKILCIIDGMTDADFRVEEYPNLSTMRLERWVDTCRGQAPETLGCILHLLGVKKVPEHLRGYAEALGNDIPVGANDLVLRGSWMGLDGQGRCTLPVAAPENVPQGKDHCYYPLGPYQCLLVFPGMASFVSDMVTFPPYACNGQRVRQMRPTGCRRVSQLFDDMQTEDRCLILWGQAVPTGMEPFPRRATLISGTPVVRGIGRLLGMEVRCLPGSTGDVDTDLLEKGKAALDAAKTCPFVLLHINGADEAAHRKNMAEKRTFLQKVDDIVLTTLLSTMHDIYVVADHGTDPVTGRHLSGKQPVFTNVPDLTGKKREKIACGSEAVLAQQKRYAIALLQKKAAQIDRVPVKSDFDEIEVIKIKKALGPWPRALEAAGLKQKRGDPQKCMDIFK